MLLVESSLTEFALLEDSVKMRFISSPSLQFEPWLDDQLDPPFSYLLITQSCITFKFMHSHQLPSSERFFDLLQARYFFQQLISGVSYCHSMVIYYLKNAHDFLFRLSVRVIFLSVFLLLQQICHRDLKLENTLLDGSPAPRLKICDFGYSKV